MSERLPDDVVDAAVAQWQEEEWVRNRRAYHEQRLRMIREERARWVTTTPQAYASTGTGLHKFDCHIIRNLIDKVDECLAFPPPFDPDGQAVIFDKYPTWLTEAEARMLGREYRRCQLCAPGIPMPDKKPKRPVRSGLGWPTDEGKCANSPARPRW